MTAQEMSAKLVAPFDASEVKFKAQAVSKDGTKALAVAYVDARVVMDRLDSVFGLGGWKTSYRSASAGAVVCTLTVKVGDEWVSHEDVGSPSEQKDAADRLKSAFSDGLKRAAVHIGVGRYLYKAPAQWVDYDGGSKSFVRTPKLPAAPARRSA
jgi:hypothetical protein